MIPIEIRKDIYAIKTVDWDIRDFHGYSVNKGSTYNSYLIMDEKITLFDTCKKEFLDDYLNTLSKIVDPTKIDYMIVNHVEMDHSGSLPGVLEIVKPKKIFCSSMAKKGLLKHFFRADWPLEVVSPDSPLNIGKRNIQFIETRMLHWPDSMVSYVPEDRLLISSDAFGQHWATSEAFDDQVDTSELMAHAAKYYANILLLFSPLVVKTLKKISDLGLNIDMIAPDHGLIWRKEPGRIISAYDKWSRQEPKRRALVVFDTMWHSTEKMARAVTDGLLQEGVEFKLLDLRVTHRSDVMTEIMDAGALILGSPTLNNGMLPRMADMLCYMKGLRPVNKLGAAFGSYGWSGEAVKLLNQSLEEMKMKVVDPGIRVEYVPGEEDLKSCVQLGRTVAQSLKEITG